MPRGQVTKNIRRSIDSNNSFTVKIVDMKPSIVDDNKVGDLTFKIHKSALPLIESGEITFDYDFLSNISSSFNLEEYIANQNKKELK